MTTNEQNAKKIAKALEEFSRHPFGELTFSKYNGIIKSYKINTEVRFNDGKDLAIEAERGNT